MLLLLLGYASLIVFDVRAAWNLEAPPLFRPLAAGPDANPDCQPRIYAYPVQRLAGSATPLLL